MNIPNGLTPGRLYSLICAVAGEEITVREFHSALKPLACEQLQFVGTVLSLQAVLREQPALRISTAGAICRARALKARSLN